jgi:hypothetical protein
MMPSTAADVCARYEDEALLEWVAERYDRCHPDDSFCDLVRRSIFSKEDRRLMEDWLESGRARRGS